MPPKSRLPKVPDPEQPFLFEVPNSLETTEISPKPFVPDKLQASKFLNSSIRRLGDANKIEGLHEISQTEQGERELTNRYTLDELTVILGMTKGVSVTQRERAFSEYGYALRALHGDEVLDKKFEIAWAFRRFRQEYGGVGSEVQQRRSRAYRMLSGIKNDPAKDLPDMYYDPNMTIIASTSLGMTLPWSEIATNVPSQEATVENELDTSPDSVRTFLGLDTGTIKLSKAEESLRKASIPEYVAAISSSVQKSKWKKGFDAKNTREDAVSSANRVVLERLGPMRDEIKQYPKVLSKQSDIIDQLEVLLGNDQYRGVELSNYDMVVFAKCLADVSSAVANSQKLTKDQQVSFGQAIMDRMFKSGDTAYAKSILYVFSEYLSAKETEFRRIALATTATLSQYATKIPRPV